MGSARYGRYPEDIVRLRGHGFFVRPMAAGRSLVLRGSRTEPEARSDFLDKHCAGDAELRKEIETLLESAEKPMDFLHQSVRDAAHQMMVEDRREFTPGTELADYKIMSLLGAGDMGELYWPKTYV